jgi:hypothetical protein
VVSVCVVWYRAPISHSLIYTYAIHTYICQHFFLLHTPQDAWHPVAWVYFSLIVLVCSFFAINLVLAVIFDAFADAKVEVRA